MALRKNEFRQSSTASTRRSARRYNKDNLYFTSFKDQRRLHAISEIEATFTKFWSVLNCPLITGLQEITNDEGLKEQGLVATHCRRGQVDVEDVSRADFSRFAAGVCSVNRAQREEVDVALKRLEASRRREKEVSASGGECAITDDEVFIKYFRI